MPIYPNQSVIKSSQKSSIWQVDIFDILRIYIVKKLPTQELAIFCRKLSFLLGSGLTLKQSFPILIQQTKNKILATAISTIHRQVLQGESFSSAMERSNIFPSFMCGYFAMGEQTGKLSNVCDKLADYYENQSQTKKQLTAAMIYPAAVITMMLAVIIFAVTMVLPGFTRIFTASDIPLPFVTLVLLNTSNFLVQNALFLFITILMSIIIFIWHLKTPKGQQLYANLLLKIPIIRQGINFHIAQSIALMLSAGINISTAIPLCIEIVDNVRVKKDLAMLSANVNTGHSFSESLKDIPYIDPLLTDLAMVGEETGCLAQTMEKCSNYFDENYRSSIQSLNKLVEPIITLVMGVLLAIVMLAVVLPTFQLATAM